MFGRQAIPMVWDFAESSPFSRSAGSLFSGLRNLINRLRLLGHVPSSAEAHAWQTDARHFNADKEKVVVSTDPPYYDNISYADLSDFFYVWHRRALKSVHPELFRTVLVPKAPELVASPYRHGGKQDAQDFFREGMAAAMQKVSEVSTSAIPTAIYYAFKQADSSHEGTASTGWETFLEGLLASGYAVQGTWPFRTEPANRMGASTTNSLASCVVVSCRPRKGETASLTRGDFRRLLRQELPPSLLNLQKGNVAPVDMAQASIGPGMAIFSRYSKVVEADGSAMSVRTALQMINEVVDEVHSEEGSDLDRETRFAITWFETHGFAEGPYGDSATLATAHNVAVESVARAGLLHTAAGKTRLLTREQLPEDWDPASDTTLTVWECTQHLIKRLEEKGEGAASSLLRAIGPRAEAARTLAYRLYTHCERKGDAEEARAYNGLVVAWPELERLGSLNSSTAQAAGSQAGLFESNN